MTVDIEDAAAVSQALAGLRSMQYQLDCFPAAEIERDAELFRGRTRQFLFISSASVYQKPVSHYLVTESTPVDNSLLGVLAAKDRLRRMARARVPRRGLPR